MFGFGKNANGSGQEAEEEVVSSAASIPAAAGNKKMCIGLDHGNGFTKAKSNDVEFVLPSLIARAEEFSGEIYGSKVKDVKNYQVLYAEGDDQKYAWGNDANKAIQPIKSYATEDRYTKLPYKLLTSFALAELIGRNHSAKAVVVTGLPSEEKDTKLEQELAEVYLGTHLVEVNGREKKVEVTDVKVVPQPLGTLLYHYLDEEGYVLDEKFESEDFYCGVIDVGSGTSDLDGLKELEIVPKDRRTIRKGMFQAYEEIAAYIRKVDPRVNIEKEEVEMWIRKKEQTDENPYVYNPTGRISVDFEQAAKTAFKRLAEDVIMEIDQSWNKSYFNEIYLTGGGAKTLGKYFKEWDKDIIVVENHQMANAIGFHRYAKYLQMDEHTA